MDERAIGRSASERRPRVLAERSVEAPNLSPWFTRDPLAKFGSAANVLPLEPGRPLATSNGFLRRALERHLKAASSPKRAARENWDTKTSKRASGEWEELPRSEIARHNANAPAAPFLRHSLG